MHADWKDRLNQWAPEPPKESWERLSEQLAEDPQPRYAEKLRQFSALPPGDAWASIAAQLEPPSKTPVIRLFPRNRYVRMISVAASVALGVILFRQMSPSGGEAPRPTDVLQENSFLPLPRPANNQATATPELGRPQQPAPAAVGGSASFAVYAPVPQISTDPLPIAKSERVYTAAFQEVVPNPAPELADGYVDRYLVVAVSEDAAIRIPKKLYDLFHCGTEPVADDCSEWLNRLRQQSAAPSRLTPADFAGVLELLQQVEN